MALVNVSGCVQDHAHTMSNALQQATTTEQVLEIVQYAVDLFLGEASVSLPEVPRGLAGTLDQTHQNIGKAAESKGRASITEAFWNSGFQLLADTLLFVATPDFLSSSEQLRHLLTTFFCTAPASAALSSLLGHLATVQPAGVPQLHAAAVTSVGAQFAAETLRDRFVVSSNMGIAQLKSEIDASTDKKGTSTGQEIAEAFAVQLASIPERAAATWIPELQPRVFVLRLVQSCLERQPVSSSEAGFRAASQNRGSEASTSAATRNPEKGRKDAARCGAASQQTSGSRLLLAAVLSKLVRRGYSQQVAGSLWSAERQSSGRRNHIAMSIQGITDSSAAEKLVEAVLVAAAGQQMAETEQLEILCEAFEQRVPASLTVACGFRSLLKYVLGDKMLLAAKLPPRCLQLLIRLLERLQSSNSVDIDFQQIVSNVAQAWGSEEAVAMLPLKQQAYLSAALVLSLRALGKDSALQAPGLQRALLEGISTRLDNALEPIRRQAMRVGRQLASTLNPEQPLFEEDPHNLELLPEEAWHRDCTGTEFGIPSSISTAQAAAETSGARSPLEQPAMGHRALIGADSEARPSKETGKAKVNKELLSLEQTAREKGREEGTLSDANTATDSDDSLEPYDLTEDKDEGEGRVSEDSLSFNCVGFQLGPRVAGSTSTA